MTAKQNMKAGIRYRFQKGDILAVALVVVLAVLIAALFLRGQGASAAFVEVYRDGELVQTLPLDEDTELTLTNRYTNTITIRDGKVAVTASDCPGEDCVNCGWIESPARSIVCLPNGVELRIIADDGDVDFVVG